MPPLVFTNRQVDRQRRTEGARELSVKEIPASFIVELAPRVINLKLCYDLMCWLLAQEADWIEPFRRRRAAADHASVIKDPLFLDGIREQLMDGRIASPSVFADKLNMVWEQAMQQSVVGTPIHVLAERWRSAVDCFWLRCEPPPVFDGQDLLRQAKTALDSALSELEVVIPQEPRPTIPPATVTQRAWVRPAPAAKVVQVLKPVGPVAITTAQQRRALAIRLRAERPDSRAWAILKEHIRAEDLARGSINLREFTQETLTDVAAAIG